jgi:hypothetical protein
MDSVLVTNSIFVAVAAAGAVWVCSRLGGCTRLGIFQRDLVVKVPCGGTAVEVAMDTNGDGVVTREGALELDTSNGASKAVENIVAEVVRGRSGKPRSATTVTAATAATTTSVPPPLS